MRAISSLFLLLCVASPAATWSFDSILSSLREKIERVFRENGTLSAYSSYLIQRLTGNGLLNSSLDSSDSPFNFEQRLKELRKEIGESLRNSTLTLEQEKEIEALLEKLSEKVRDHILETGDTLAEVNEKANVSGAYYQGDMILVKSQMDDMEKMRKEKEKRQAFRDSLYPEDLWMPNLYYYFDDGLPTHARGVAAQAIKFWHDNTCVNFVESRTAPDRVKIFKGRGCYSYVGKIGGEQELSLGRGCESVGTAAHELGHALGFFHEQSRYDRDSALRIVVSNIVPNFVDQFDKETPDTNYNYRLPYDYGSIMQYGGTSASVNGKPTMISVDPSYQDTMGSDIVSFIDVSMMNDNYNCKAKCAFSRTECENDGFPHPRDCTKCICPAGYGGDYCTERPGGCGASLNATINTQHFTYSVGLGDVRPNDQFVFCNWVIQAPVGQKVKATITSYTPSSCVEGCVYGGVELKWQAKPIQTGSRYCCTNDVGSSVTSESNSLRVIGFNRYSKDTFTLSYVAVAA